MNAETKNASSNSDAHAAHGNGHASAEASAASSATSEAAAAPDADAQADMVVALEAERNDLKDKLLRTLADMENLRRRTEREVTDARNYGVTKLATDMVTVVDNLRRALESIPADALGAADGPFKAFIDGVELTERDLLKSLERHGVKKIDPKGEKFDPNLHQAMFEAPEPETPKGHVTQVVQPGFTINGRSLRAALVGVSSGGPKVDKTV